jgi:hypothetical protein
MADKKITDLTAISTIALDDVLPIVDVSEDITKKITIAQVKSTAPVQSVNGKIGVLNIDKTDVGLGNCDNTADLDKPISTATQTALNGKQNSLGFTAENIANKSTTLDTDKLSNIKYPSVKSVYDWAIGLFLQKNTAITPSTKTKITYDANGLVTAGADLSASDIPTGIDASKVSTGVVSNTEFNYLDGVTSAIQTQLDSKQNSLGFTPENVSNKSISVTTDQASNTKYPSVKAVYDWAVGLFATISSVAAKQDTLVSGTNIKTLEGQSLLGSGNIDLAKSDVGLGNVDNTSDANKPVSTAQQTALDAKTNKLVTANRQTASYTLVLSDADKLIEMNVATANNLTIPLNSSVAFATGTQILLAQYGAGQTTLVPTSGVTIRSNGAKVKLNAQYSGATLIKIDTNEWYLFGDIA